MDIVLLKIAYLSIGPLSLFDDEQPDYVEKLKKSFKADKPLIPMLLDKLSSWNSAIANIFPTVNIKTAVMNQKIWQGIDLKSLKSEFYTDSLPFFDYLVWLSVGLSLSPCISVSELPFSDNPKI